MWKDSLQPGMTINLDYNYICFEWADAIVNNWKDKLQPEMTIVLSWNFQIWSYWADIIKDMVLKGWVTIKLQRNKISEDQQKELKDWEKSYIDQWIHCEVLV
jgi:hypothetical protein